MATKFEGVFVTLDPTTTGGGRDHPDNFVKRIDEATASRPDRDNGQPY
jgi:hypothetical protein